MYLKPTSFYEIKPRKKEHFIGTRKIIQNGGYELRFQYSYKNNACSAPHHLEHNNTLWSQVVSSTEELFNNSVYNLSVKDDESYTANNSVCHNCTHLAVSGARWFKNKTVEQADALDFVRFIMALPVDKICIENPVSIISSKIRKPDQIIQPYWFGDPFQKTTCLWLKNLPLLTPTNIVSAGPSHTTKSGKSIPVWYNIPPGPDRWKLRSKSFPGIAKAFADQWG